MKCIAIVFALVSVASAIKQEIFELPQERLVKLRAISDACAKEHNVDPELILKIPDAAVPRGEANDKYLQCCLLKSGIVVEDGHINVDKLVGLLGDHPIAEEFKATLRKCNEITKENPIETMVEMSRCVVATSPVHFVLK